MVQAALPSPCTLRRPPVCTRLFWVSAQSCPGSHAHPLLRRWPWRRATPRACGRSCRASRSGERGSRTWQQLDWFDSEVRSLVGLSSLVPEGVAENEPETCVTTVSFCPLGRRCALPSRVGARLTKANTEIKDEAPTEHLAAGQLRSQLCASLAGVRWRLGSAAIAGANWAATVHTPVIGATAIAMDVLCESWRRAWSGEVGFVGVGLRGLAMLELDLDPSSDVRSPREPSLT